jgi:thioesterase domain-containing protein
LWGYANLAAKLGADQPVFAIEPRQRAGAHPQTVEEMARRYVGELREFQPRGPYYLGGYCFGGYIAYEMARQLSERGDAVALLALIDAAAPNGSYERIPWWRPSYAFAFLRNCYYWFENFRRWKGSEQRSFLRRKSIVAVKRMLRKVKLISADPDLLEVEDFIDSSNFPEDELALWETHLHAGGEYVPKKYSGKVTLLRTRIQPVFCSLDPRYGWGELAQGGVEVKLISGSHENIFLEPDLESLAEKLNNCLANAQAQKKYS